MSIFVARDDELDELIRQPCFFFLLWEALAPDSSFSIQRVLEFSWIRKACLKGLLDAVGAARSCRGNTSSIKCASNSSIAKMMQMEKQRWIEAEHLNNSYLETSEMSWHLTLRHLICHPRCPYVSKMALTSALLAFDVLLSFLYFLLIFFSSIFVDI